LFGFLLQNDENSCATGDISLLLRHGIVESDPFQEIENCKVPLAKTGRDAPVGPADKIMEIHY
jgi:hypothetical protein